MFFFSVFDVSSNLVANEVNGVVGVAVLEQEVRVDRSGHDAGLQPAEASELGVARGHRPQGHGVEEVDILGRRLLYMEERRSVKQQTRNMGGGDTVAVSDSWCRLLHRKKYVPSSNNKDQWEGNTGGSDQEGYWTGQLAECRGTTQKKKREDKNQSTTHGGR